MNILREFPGQGRTPDALADIARIEALPVVQGKVTKLRMESL